ncbi:MAG: helix-turn-helix domain-containing protein [Lachnospiraceae bacterium]
MEFDYSEIGTNIRSSRKKRGITQEELANIADISTQHLCRIENGVRTPSLETVHRIADALGITTDALFGNTAIEAVDYQEELKMIFDDCSEYEKNVIGEILVNAKKSIRKSLPLIDKEK